MWDRHLDQLVIAFICFAAESRALGHMTRYECAFHSLQVPIILVTFSMVSCLGEAVNICHFKVPSVCSEITKSKTLLVLEEIPKVMIDLCFSRCLIQLRGDWRKVILLRMFVYVRELMYISTYEYVYTCKSI